MQKKSSLVNKIPTIVLIGRPNVGKSTLFNRLAAKRLALESDEAGTTRDWREEKISKKDRSVRIIDCAGLDSQSGELSQNIQTNLKAVIEKSDLILWLVDGSLGLDSRDLAWQKKVRSFNKESWLIVNKCDNQTRLLAAEEYQKLGFAKVFYISALHQKNIFTLKKELFKLAGEEISDQEELKKIKFVVVGRPNVGKSSLINTILKDSRTTVSSLPGTTRDAIEVETLSSKINWSKAEPTVVNLVDTAGIRQASKIANKIEKESIGQTINQITNADIIILTVDASEGILKQDLHIAGLGFKLGKSIIIVVNKWDLVTDRTAESEKMLRQKFINQTLVRAKFLNFSPIIFTSVKTGQHIADLRQLLEEIWLNRHKVIASTDLEKFLNSAPYPVLSKITKIEQSNVNPPQFTISNQQKFHSAEIRQLKNALREYFGFYAAPIRIEFSCQSELSK